MVTEENKQEYPDQEEVKLSDRQELFIEAYLSCGLNGVKAAKRAGYTGGYNSLAATASRLLRDGKVRTEINKRLKLLSMGADEVIQRLADHAMASLEDFTSIDPETGNTVTDFAKAKKRNKLHLLKELKIQEIKNPLNGEVIGQVVNFKLVDSQAALNTLAKAYGLLIDKTELTGKDGESLLPIQIRYIPPDE